MATERAVQLRVIVGKLQRYYGAPARPFPTDPFQQLLWENVAYLASDTTRRAAFLLLKRTVGLGPEEILSASKAELRAVTSHGILPDKFVEKLRTTARIALGEFDGNMKEVVRRPLPVAKRALRTFPGIGEPGAEKILLFSGQQALLAPDSNALRVMKRVGVAPDRKSYAASYAAARDVAEAQLGHDVKKLQAAHQLLRQHGQELCKASRPACERCPVAPQCAYARSARA